MPWFPADPQCKVCSARGRDVDSRAVKQNTLKLHPGPLAPAPLRAAVRAAVPAVSGAARA